ncbi:hypothetical protein [Nocardia cyriacigeorgica]|nr:hypothetical protein [Nocardia cyriacigeorgica]
MATPGLIAFHSYRHGSTATPLVELGRLRRNGYRMGIDVKTAVEQLHDDLAAWLGSEADDAVFERFADAQHEAFSMVTTAGETLRRSELLDGLRAARNASPGLRIEISEFEEVAAENRMVVVRFLESHHHAGQISRRRVTAVLVAADGEPALRWLTVHETPVAAS